MMRRILPVLAGALVGGVLLAAPISGNSLTFDGLQNGEQVLTYYDGGFGGFGSGPGPFFGVSFTAGLAADSTMIAFGPSTLVQLPVIMNLDNPWADTVSFYYAGTGSISFYSGKDANGTLLASDPLMYGGPFGFPFGAAPGSFQSAVFAPVTSGSLRVDSITFGGVVVPEPSTVILFIAGMLVALWRLRRDRGSSSAGCLAKDNLVPIRNVMRLRATGSFPSGA
jgi:hypothetical protein